MLKSVPVLEVANVCVLDVNKFNDANPLPLAYCGMFKVEPTIVAAPLVPVVVNVNVACFAFKAFCKSV